MSRYRKSASPPPREAERKYDAAERWLRLIAIVLLAVLVLSQIGLRSETIRRWITPTERLEGMPLR